MIRENRKTEIKMFEFNQGVTQETYYLMNKQIEREVDNNPPKNIEERIFEDQPLHYPKALMINELVD
jgi:hypothetical protein